LNGSRFSAANYVGKLILFFPPHPAQRCAAGVPLHFAHAAAAGAAAVRKNNSG